MPQAVLPVCTIVCAERLAHCRTSVPTVSSAAAISATRASGDASADHGKKTSVWPDAPEHELRVAGVLDRAGPAPEVGPRSPGPRGPPRWRSAARRPRRSRPGAPRAGSPGPGGAGRRPGPGSRPGRYTVCGSWTWKAASCSAFTTSAWVTSAACPVGAIVGVATRTPTPMPSTWSASEQHRHQQAADGDDREPQRRSAALPPAGVLGRRRRHPGGQVIGRPPSRWTWR